LGVAIIMEDLANIRRLISAAKSRILLICPDCGQEHLEFADQLRSARFYACHGEGCDYRFDLSVDGRPRRYLRDLAEAFKRRFAVFYPAR
jgi:hypothetical protein